MSTRRERAKEPTVKLNKQLAEMAEKAKAIEKARKRNMRKADFFEDLSKLVFGGALIGGIFENVGNPILLYTVGGSIFFLLVWYGNRYFEQGIKDD